jgi:hypothetical protein
MERHIETQDPKRPGALANGELTEGELDQVSGGLVVTAIIAVLIGLLVPKYEPPKY